MSSKLFSSSKRWEKYFALTATSLSTLPLAAGEARAAMVKVLDRPVAMPTTDGIANWDIDGTGSVDFQLDYDGSYGFFNSVSRGGALLGGKGLVVGVNGRQVNKLASGFVVSPVLAAGNIWNNLESVKSVSYFQGNMSHYSFRQFTAGDNFFAFRFDKNSDGNLHYGFAIANVVDPYDDAQFKITKWAYNDVPGAPLTVGPLNADPAGVPGPIGLAGLAAGAACSRRLRKRIRQAS